MKENEVIENLRSFINDRFIAEEPLTEEDFDPESNDPEIIAEERVKFNIRKMAQLSRLVIGKGYDFKAYSVPADIQKEYKDKGKITSIANIIDEIYQNVPLVRRDNGSPDVLATCRAIKEFDANLWGKLVIYSLLPRSTWSGGIPRYPGLASFTPILLAAYKPVAKFSEWDTEKNFDSPVAMYVALGTELANMMYARPKTMYEYDEAFITEFSFNGTKKPTFKILDVFTPAIVKSALLPHLATKPFNIKNYVCMLSQTWIAHPSKRNPDTMILDIYDWDLVPEPLLALEEPTVIKTKEWDDI